MVAKKNTTSKKKPITRKKTPSARVSSKRSKKAEVRSFRVTKPDTPFMTFSITRQTLYWLILAIIFIGFGLWINKLQSDIQSIYDTIDSNMNSLDYTIEKKR